MGIFFCTHSLRPLLNIYILEMARNSCGSALYKLMESYLKEAFTNLLAFQIVFDVAALVLYGKLDITLLYIVTGRPDVTILCVRIHTCCTYI